jgi:hypothetical protein
MNKRLTPFQRALVDSVLREYADIPNNEDLPDTYSDDFKVWFELFSKNRGRRLRVGTVVKRILIAAIIAVLLACAAMAIPAIREAVIDFFFHEDEIQIGITFDPEQAATAPEKILQSYTVTYVPNTFMLGMEMYEKDAVQCWWMDDADQWITFTQSPMPDKPTMGTWWYFEGEETSRKSVLMGDYLVEILDGEEYYKLVWTNNEYVFILELPYSVNEEEMQKIFASWGPKE